MTPGTNDITPCPDNLLIVSSRGRAHLGFQTIRIRTLQFRTETLSSHAMSKLQSCKQQLKQQDRRLRTRLVGPSHINITEHTHTHTQASTTHQLANNSYHCTTRPTLVENLIFCSALSVKLYTMTATRNTCISYPTGQTGIASFIEHMSFLYFSRHACEPVSHQTSRYDLYSPTAGDWSERLSLRLKRSPSDACNASAFSKYPPRGLSRNHHTHPPHVSD